MHNFAQAAVASFRFLVAPISVTPKISDFISKDEATWPEPIDLKFDHPSLYLSLLDSDLLNVFERCYIKDLAPHFIVFGTTEPITVTEKDKSAEINWKKAYKKYCQSVLKGIDSWTDLTLDSGHELTQDGIDIVHAMKNRVEFLLTANAISHFPVLRHLSTSIPVFCPSFFADLAKSLHKVELGIAEVSKFNIFTM